MLNVSLVRRAQLSLMDPKRQFDMNRWDCCIAGHIVKGYKDQGHEIAFKPWSDNPTVYAAGLINITPAEALPLFTTWGNAWYTRKQAVARLDQLIADHADDAAKEEKARQAKIAKASKARALRSSKKTPAKKALARVRVQTAERGTWDDALAGV
jgi:hypothetical protein